MVAHDNVVGSDLTSPAARHAAYRYARLAEPARRGSGLIIAAHDRFDEPRLPAVGVATGTKIGRYIVAQRLGTGGMGVVYSARDTELARDVALKIVRPRAEVAAMEARLRREAMAMARLSHPNLVPVFDIGAHDGQLFIAMELVAGDTLRAWVAQPKPWRSVVQLFAKAGRGLAAAHAAGLLHRDFKPDNVMVGAGDEPRITDFGLARELEDAPVASSPFTMNRDRALSQVTATGGFAGTPAYMAPELLLGNQSGSEVDQFSFCVSLFEVLYGTRPFHTTLSGPEAWIDEIRAGRIAKPAATRAVPSWLHAAIVRGLAFDPRRRWPSMTALIEALGPRHARRGQVWALAVLGVAVLGAVAGASSVVLRSRLQDPATEPARLAALAESLEAGLRIEHLAPAHDLRPALAKIRAQVERLRPDAALGNGAASFALGKGLELLGDDAAARVAYERAWTAGFRLPGVADGLGSVLSNLYQQAYSQARGSLTGQPLDERLAILHRELAVPAMKYLAQSGQEPWRVAMHRAAIALLSRDFSGARAAAAEVLDMDPGHYEALGLQAEAWRDEALSVPDRTFATELLTHAFATADAAAQYGRSDQKLALLRIEIRWRLLRRPVGRADATGSARISLPAAIDEASLMNPDAPGPFVSRGNLRRLQAREAEYTGYKNALPWFEEAVRAFRKAAELDGGEARTLNELAFNLSNYAHDLIVLGSSDAALPLIDEGLHAIDQARAREPMNAEAHLFAQVLHHEKAFALRSQHHVAQSFDELRRAISFGEEAIRLGFPDGYEVRVLTGTELVRLAEDTWLSGRDPRPEGRTGLTMIEDGRRRSGGDLWATSELLLSTGQFARQALRLGDDPTDAIREKTKLIDAILEHHPDIALAKEYKGWFALLEARSRLAAGHDPGAMLAEAERLLAASVPVTENDQGHHFVVEVAIVGAHWRVLRGKDPTAQLRKAQVGIEQQSRSHPGWGTDLVAEAALEAALWARRSGRSAEHDARHGLAALERALADEPRDASSWVEKAALEALAGEAATARVSLDHAVLLNGLVRGSHAFKDAQALVRP